MLSHGQKFCWLLLRKQIFVSFFFSVALEKQELLEFVYSITFFLFRDKKGHLLSANLSYLLFFFFISVFYLHFVLGSCSSDIV